VVQWVIMSTPTAYPHITSDPSVAGGQPCVAETGISVADLATAHEANRSAASLQEYFRGRAGRPLTLGEVHSALAYFYDHREALALVAADNKDRADKATRDHRDAIIRRFSGR
jgi:uncharacterized protein (DUF433 family)